MSCVPGHADRISADIGDGVIAMLWLRWTSYLYVLSLISTAFLISPVFHLNHHCHVLIA